MENVIQLLNDEIAKFHEVSMDVERNVEEREAAHKMEMNAISQLRQLEEQKSSGKWKLVEHVACPVGLKVLDGVVMLTFMFLINDFEKNYTYTTTAGKAISSWFRFKK